MLPITRIVFLLFFTPICLAKEPSEFDEEHLESSYSKVFKKLESYNPNFFGFGIPIDGNGLDDETHLELNLSILYPLWTNKSYPDRADSNGLWWDRISFVYTGAYDFYALGDRYSSSPIISRHQNPGLVFEFLLDKDSNSDKTLIVSYFHESNGQTLDDREEFDEISQESSQGLERALTQVSRGWDYIGLGYEQSGQLWRGKYKFRAEYRTYLPKQFFSRSREDDIFWDDNLSNQVRINDFDGLRIMLEKNWALHTENTWFRNFTTRLEFKTGTRDFDALENLSFKASLAKKWGDAWVSLFYFDGYGKEISTYHRRTSYVGFGLEFR